MSLNTENAILSNAIKVDSSYNVGIGGTPGPYKLDVFGTGRFTGQLTGNGSGASSAIIFNNTVGASGTAQYYADFTSGATVLGRILRGNGASGYEANGLNIDNYSGMQIKLNALGGSGGAFSVIGGNAVFGGTIAATGLTTGTTGGSTISITTSSNAGTSGSPLQTKLNFLGYNGNINGQIRVDDISSTAQVGSMAFYTWNSAQVLALTLAHTGAATFTSTIQNVSGVYVRASSNSDQPFINFSNSDGVYNWGRVGGLLQGDGDGSLYFQTKLGGSLGTRLTITSTGAATFTNNITAQTGVFNTGAYVRGDTESLIITTISNTNRQLLLGYQYGGNYGIIQSVEQGVAYRNISINALGGNVLIGTTTDSGYRFRVQGTSFLNGSTTVGGGYLQVNGQLSVYHDGTSIIQDSNPFDTGSRTVLRIIGGTYNAGSDTTSKMIKFESGNGTEIGYIIRNGGNTISYVSSSDYRLKEDFKDFDALSLISKIKTYDFKWKGSDYRDYGVIAHELKDIIPNIVSGNKDDIEIGTNRIKPQGVDYGKLGPVLVKAVQELEQKIKDQDVIISQLQNKIS